MNPRIHQRIAQDGPMLNTARMVNIYHLLSQTLVFGVPGDVAELGCHEGQCALLLREILDDHRSEKSLHLYDSFLGLPNHGPLDEGAVFAPGTLRASYAKLLANFTDAGLALPEVHAGWFSQILPEQLPKVLSFVHIDADLYASIREGLEAVYPRLAASAIVIVDDYGWEGLPGVTVAVDEFLSDKPEKLCPMRLGPTFDATHAYFRKA
jgi:O-methyltransferase